MCARIKEAWQTCSLQYAYLQGYQLSEYETMVFVPCLIEKAGHNQVCSCPLFACKLLLAVPQPLLPCAKFFLLPCQFAMSLRMFEHLYAEHGSHGDMVQQSADHFY